MRQQAVWAAVVTCVEVTGKPATKPVVLQDTNNVVVHLAPCPVVAKVGRFPWSAEVLAKEVRVGRHLADAGAPVAAPIADLVIEPGTLLPVSLWERLELTGELPTPADAAAALRVVHDALRTIADPLPSWTVGHDLAWATLVHDGAMAALPAADLALLRTAFEAWAAEAREVDPATFQPLHGEPHTGNVVATTAGIRVIDFEATCIGPLEADLACLDPAVIDAGGWPVDDARLDLARRLGSAIVATWCWASEHPEMRQHAEHHLEVVRRRWNP